MNIVQISTRDVLGGAEKVAFDLCQGLRTRGHRSILAVGYKSTDDGNVVTLPHAATPSLWSSFWWQQFEQLQPGYRTSRLSRLACKTAHTLAEPLGAYDRWQGREDCHYPGIHHLIDSLPFEVDVIHAHNLHGGYFDLRALPGLSRSKPMILSLHDAWLLSGHCAHSLDCDRWKIGCGCCPALELYPAVRRDETNENWLRKRDIFARSTLRIAVPCRWLQEKVEQSMLAPAVVEMRVIPYGVDLDLFQSGDQQAARRQLGLDASARVLLFAANGIRHNVWKDYELLKAVLARVASRFDKGRLILIALGEEGEPEDVGGATIQFVPFQNDPALVARYYQAADLYVHASRADTFPLSILEALASGTPVAATAVGGIAEQVKNFQFRGAIGEGVDCGYAVNEATGVLSSPGDVEAMSGAVSELLADDALRLHLAENAARDARIRFDQERHLDNYLDWYCEFTAHQARLPQESRHEDASQPVLS